MRKIRFAAGITFYNPTKEEIDKALSLEDSFDKVFIFDNSDPSYIKPRYEFPEKYEILTENENKGLPYAYNSIIERCHDIDFLCTMDQDSVFLPNDINNIKKFIETENPNVGIMAPFVDYGHNNRPSAKKVEKKEWVITSGSFVNLNILRNEGFAYDDNYFIDKFEIDLCMQYKRKGYDVLMYNGSVLHQALGEESGHSHPNHSTLRHYYLFRNRFYFNSKWNQGIKKVYLNLAQTSRHIFLIILYEDEKCKKIKTLKSAIDDYRYGRFGKK